jgi:hypothetical protein
MMSTESPDLYEVTCLDCQITKSYFTAQGARFFKSYHEGHKVTVKEPSAAPQAHAVNAPVPVEKVAPKPKMDLEMEAEPALEPEPERGSHAQGRLASVIEEEAPVKLGNLVVDVVDDEAGRSIKVYGIAGGFERFTKDFKFQELDGLNGLLESGIYVDGTTGVRYTWSPDKIDISRDVVKMLDEPPASAPAEDITMPAMEAAPAVEAAVEPPTESKVNVSLAPELQEAPSPDLKSSSSRSDEVPLGKTSPMLIGEAYKLESDKISKALKTFQWNAESPYIIGAILDDLVSVQSQTGMMKSSVIDAIVNLGYTFVAIEAPEGRVTAWFRKVEAGQKE